MRRRNRERGFTLIELLIVITIILIIAAFTIPRITKATDPCSRDFRHQEYSGDSRRRDDVLQQPP